MDTGVENVIHVPASIIIRGWDFSLSPFIPPQIHPKTHLTGANLPSLAKPARNATITIQLIYTRPKKNKKREFINLAIYIQLKRPKKKIMRFIPVKATKTSLKRFWDTNLKIFLLIKLGNSVRHRFRGRLSQRVGGRIKTKLLRDLSWRRQWRNKFHLVLRELHVVHQRVIGSTRQRTRITCRRWWTTAYTFPPLNHILHNTHTITVIKIT